MAGTVVHLAQFDARTGRVVKKMDSELGRGERRQGLFTTLYGRYLCQAVSGILNVAREAVKNSDAVEFDNEGTRLEEGRTVCGISKRTNTVASRVPSAEKMQLEVRK